MGNDYPNQQISSHFRGSAPQGKRPQPPHELPPQQPQEHHPSPFLAGHQQHSLPVRASDEPQYQEQHVTTPGYDEYQQSLPSITSLLGNVQPTEQPQSPPHRRGLPKTQNSPNIRAHPPRTSRSPFPGTTRPRNQVFNPPSAPTRRESGPVVVAQGWRDESQQHEAFFPQPQYSMEPQISQSRPQPQSQPSPVRSTFPTSYISPQEPSTTHPFELPYYPSQDPSMGQLVSAPSQSPFYPPPTPPTYMTPGTELIPMQPQYPFNTVVPTMPTSGITYVGDSRGMLSGLTVPLGGLRGPPRIGISPQEEDKRRRAASASARFRRRKKEQEEENLKEITRLEKRIEELKKERDYWRDLAIRAGASGTFPPHSHASEERS